jgi:hypothetical protein
MKARNVPPNPLYEQVQVLQAHIKQLERRIDEHERLISDLRQHILELTGRNEASQQLLAVLTSLQSPDGEKGEQTTDQIRQHIREKFSDLNFLLPRARATRKTGLAAKQERRGYDPEMLPLVDFVKLHQPAEKIASIVWEIKQLFNSGHITLTIYHREGEVKRNKQEWWTTREQRRQLTDYWHAHGIPFQTCPECEVPTPARAG